MQFAGLRRIEEEAGFGLSAQGGAAGKRGRHRLARLSLRGTVQGCSPCVPGGGMSNNGHTREHSFWYVPVHIPDGSVLTDLAEKWPHTPGGNAG